MCSSDLQPPPPGRPGGGRPGGQVSRAGVEAVLAALRPDYSPPQVEALYALVDPGGAGAVDAPRFGAGVVLALTKHVVAQSPRAAAAWQRYSDGLLAANAVGVVAACASAAVTGPAGGSGGGGDGGGDAGGDDDKVPLGLVGLVGLSALLSLLLPADASREARRTRLPRTVPSRSPAPAAACCLHLLRLRSRRVLTKLCACSTIHFEYCLGVML